MRERRTASGVVYGVRYRVRTADGWKERSYTTKRHDEALLAKINIENGQEPTRAMPDQTTLGECWESWHRRWSIGKRPKTIRAAVSARSSLDPLMSSRHTDLKRAGVEDVVAHALRHTCASLLIAAKANPLEIAEQLGHLSGGKPDPTMIWKRYGWLYEGATKSAVLRLDDLIASAP